MKYLILFTSLFFTFLFLPNSNAQEEKLEVEGAIQIGNSDDPTPDPGTIRWTGTDFQGWNGSGWVSLSSNSSGTTGYVSDIEGNGYRTIIIGNQIWMAENLKTSKYNDNSNIPNVTTNIDWANTTSGAYANYNNSGNTGNTYGKLYNWWAVNTGNLCPTGWHVPTNQEWNTLASYLGGKFSAGGRMKEAGLSKWRSPNTGATNDSGFTGFPGGSRWDDGTFNLINDLGYFWSSTLATTVNANYRLLGYSNNDLLDFALSKNYGMSVRCVKDN